MPCNRAILAPFPAPHISASIAPARGQFEAGARGFHLLQRQFGVVVDVVGKKPAKPTACTVNTTLLRHYSAFLCVCMCARACVRLSLFLCSSVVDRTYRADFLDENGTTRATTPPLHRQSGVVGRASLSANPLKNNKKGGF